MPIYFIIRDNRTFRIDDDDKKKADNCSFETPYRTQVVIDTDTVNKENKKDFVMPKKIVVFAMLIPAMITDIALGLVYDSTFFGTGFKWGCLVSAVILNIFFIVSAISRAEQKE